MTLFALWGYSMKIFRRLEMNLVAFLLCLFSAHIAGAANTANSDGSRSLASKLDELTRMIAAKIPEKKPFRIVVSDFADLEGNITNLGRYIAEELTTRLFSAKHIQVIERRMLDSVLHEQQLSMTGLIETAASKKVGAILGSDAVLAGSITNLGNSIKVNSRLIDSGSGMVVAASSITFPKDNKINILLGKAVVLRTEETKKDSVVHPQVIGLWRDSEEDKEYFYDIRENGFVFYCELQEGDVVDLDTGVIEGTMVTYSGGDREDITGDIATSEKIAELPAACR